MLRKMREHTQFTVKATAVFCPRSSSGNFSATRQVRVRLSSASQTWPQPPSPTVFTSWYRADELSGVESFLDDSQRRRRLCHGLVMGRGDLKLSTPSSQKE